MRTIYTILVFVLFLLFCSSQAKAQDNYEIQVYTSELVEIHHTAIELHSNYTTNGSTLMMGGVYPSNHVVHETLEITHGFSDWLEVGSYLFTSLGSDDRTGIAGVHVRPRITVPEEYKLPVGLSLSSEIGYQKTEFFGSRWGAEIRPIIDKKCDRLFFALNLAMGIVLDSNQSHIPDFSPCFKTTYDMTKKFGLGIEYYSSLGAINHPEPIQAQKHQVFGAIDWEFSPDWEFNAGLGYGLTSATDKWIVKFILGYKLPF